MDLITTGATIAGLLAAWDGLRDKQKNKDVAEFQRWLSLHGFNDLADAVAQNSALTESIAQTIDANHKELLAAIEGLARLIVTRGGGSVVSVSANSETGKVFAKKVAKHMLGELEDPLGRHGTQLVNLLFDDEGGELYRLKYEDGRMIRIGTEVYSEAKLKKNEFAKVWGSVDRLCDMGLLNNPDGGVVFELSGKGVEFVEAMRAGINHDS